MASAALTERGVVRISGEDARSFLDGLVTSDMGGVADDKARYAALLTPQGKILFDFIVAEADGEQGGGFYLDTSRALAADLAKRLGFYKLRAKVAVEDLSSTLCVVAFFDGEKAPNGIGVLYADPRDPRLGDRVIMERSEAEALGGDAEAYDAFRIALGLPEGGRDFIYGDAFPHEANLDRLGGVDFDKGCFVGQEVVSRMQHRGTVRTRIVPIQFDGEFAAMEGIEAASDGKPIGRIGSTANGGRALAMLRLDRVQDAIAAGQRLEAGGLAFQVVESGNVPFPFSSEAAKPVA